MNRQQPFLHAALLMPGISAGSIVSTLHRVFSSVLLAGLLLVPCAAMATDCVVLLHGLTRSSKVMTDLAEALAEEGYYTVNLDYPSTDFPIETLAGKYIPESIANCPANSRVHFVVHSMGGILLRYWLANNDTARVGRVVMLAPPNGGSELVDKLGGLPGFTWLYGPAGRQLGTGPDSLPNRLGPIGVETGVIAGTATYNPFYSWLIPGDDDGKVGVLRTKLDGMSDFILLHHTHTGIVNAKPAIGQVQQFLREGHFSAVSTE